MLFVALIELCLSISSSYRWRLAVRERWLFLRFNSAALVFKP
jgi:hypothetical protein